MGDPNMSGMANLQLEAASAPNVLSGSPVALREKIAGKTAELCLRAYSPQLLALVLTGSLARDEATSVPDGSGCKVLGDAEFLLVFQPGFAEPPRAAVDSLEKEIQTALRRDGTDVYVQLAPVSPCYFRDLGASVFAYELRERGRVVWGDASILALIPPFTAADIALEDAWRLLANRMVELLEATTEVESLGKELPQTLRYRTVKLYLDMATSLLLFAGEYAPGYRVRRHRLQSLAGSAQAGESWPFPLGQFAQQVSLATDLKLRGAGQSTAEGGWESWQEALWYARLLWDWELAHLVEAPAGKNGGELMHPWMRRRALAGLRGWMFTWRACGWLRSFPNWVRWLRLATGGSPRYWVYRAAHILFCRLPAALSTGSEGQPKEFAAALRSLPVVRHAANSPAPSWKQVVGEVAWNYHHFVEPTRA